MWCVSRRLVSIACSYLWILRLSPASGLNLFADSKVDHFVSQFQSPAGPTSSNGGARERPVEENESWSTTDLKGSIAFVAGVSDSSGFGWGIAKELHRAGATVLAGTWVPMVGVFADRLEGDPAVQAAATYSSATGKTRQLSFASIYPIDVAYDTASDVPEEVKRKGSFRKVLEGGHGFSISEVADRIRGDYGRLDFIVHAIANGPEVGKPLLDTSRKGYLGAVASSAYSMVSMIHHMGPLMVRSPHAAAVSLTYHASQKAIEGYGGGMSSAKSALESDTRTLAFEAGRRYGMRINTLSAGPLKSRAASAIRSGKRAFIDQAIEYSRANAPLRRDLTAEDVGRAALHLLTLHAVTGTVLYVDNGLNIVGLAGDSASLQP